MRRTLSTLLAGDAHLRRYVPYATCASRPAAVLGPTVQGLALVARRPLHDEELLLDYRMNPHYPRPRWYAPVDAAADARRWS